MRSQPGKVPKVAKNMRWKCSLALCIAGYALPLSVGTVLCTHKRDFATVTLIPGRCFDRGGGGVSDFTATEGRSHTSLFFRSPLDQKEAIGVVFRSMDPPQAILEPRRVRVTLNPGSTLPYRYLKLKKNALLLSYSRRRFGTPAQTSLAILHIYTHRPQPVTVYVR